MSAPLPEGIIHLLVADDGLTEGQVYRVVYMALCGELLPTSSLPSCLCAPECTSYHPYCPDCLREAVGHNAEIEQPEQDARVTR